MIKKILKEKTDNTAIQFFRSMIAGAIAFVVDFSALYILTEFFGMYYLLSAVFAFVLGVTTVYLLSIFFVFNRRTLKNKWAEFMIFAFIGAIGLGLNQFFLWFFTERAHIYYLYSKVIATAVVFIWNFFSRKYILFRS